MWQKLSPAARAQAHERSALRALPAFLPGRRPAAAAMPSPRPEPAAAAFVPGAGQSRLYPRLHPRYTTQPRLYQRRPRRYASELPLLPPGAPVPATMAAACDALRARGYDTGSALRVLRQLVL